jgi:predicted SAM-dependent methyltransferase
MGAIVSWLPKQLKKPLQQIKGTLESLFYFGKGRICPVCGKSSRRFRSFGIESREEAQCVHCGALERHRLLWLFLQKKTDLFENKPNKMLHVAPESCLEPRFRKSLNGSYITADLRNPRVMVKMDITNIQYPDQSFDVIYCSHVLEHVIDDKQAMREFRRVLKNDGWAILLVPITAEETYEDSTIVDPKERLKAFGQEDHVRRYGHNDYIGRLRSAGFTVEMFQYGDLVDMNDATLMGLTTSACGTIFYCTKASAAGN